MKLDTAASMPLPSRAPSILTPPTRSGPPNPLSPVQLSRLPSHRLPGHHPAQAARRSLHRASPVPPRSPLSRAQAHPGPVSHNRGRDAPQEVPLQPPRLRILQDPPFAPGEPLPPPGGGSPMLRVGAPSEAVSPGHTTGSAGRRGGTRPGESLLLPPPSLPPSLSWVGLDARPLTVPLLSPFAISSSVISSAQNVAVRARLSDGSWGLGEVPVLPGVTPLSQAQAQHAIEHRVGPWLMQQQRQQGGQAREDGTGVGAFWALVRELRRLEAEVLPGHDFAAVRAGVEMAVLDAVARSAGVPLWRLFGASPVPLQTDITIPLGSAEEAGRLAAEYRERGFQAIKLKTGRSSTSTSITTSTSTETSTDTSTGTSTSTSTSVSRSVSSSSGEETQCVVREDCLRVAAVMRAHPACRLLLDANEGYSEAQTLRLLEALREASRSGAGGMPLFLEQPVPRADPEALQRLTRHETRLALQQTRAKQQQQHQHQHWQQQQQQQQQQQGVPGFILAQARPEASVQAAPGRRVQYLSPLCGSSLGGGGEGDSVCVVADESCRSLEDAVEIVRSGRAHMVNVKLAKLGVLGTLDTIAVVLSSGGAPTALGMWPSGPASSHQPGDASSGRFFEASPAACPGVEAEREVLPEGLLALHELQQQQKGEEEAVRGGQEPEVGPVGLMVGGMVETRLGMGFAAHLAAGLGCFRVTDLDTPLLLAEDPVLGGYTMQGPEIILSEEPGMGCTMPW